MKTRELFIAVFSVVLLLYARTAAGRAATADFTIRKGDVYWITQFGFMDGGEWSLDLDAWADASSINNDDLQVRAPVRVLFCNDREYRQLSDPCRTLENSQDRDCDVQYDVPHGRLSVEDIEVGISALFYLGVVVCDYPSSIDVDVTVDYHFWNPTGELDTGMLGSWVVVSCVGVCALWIFLAVLGNVIYVFIRTNTRKRLRKVNSLICIMVGAKLAMLACFFLFYLVLNMYDENDAYVPLFFEAIAYSAYAINMVTFVCGALAVAMGWGIVPVFDSSLRPGPHIVHRRFLYPLHFPDYILLLFFVFFIANFTILTVVTMYSWILVAAFFALMGIAAHIRAQTTLSSLEALDPTSTCSLPRVSIGKITFPVPMVTVPDNVRELIELRSKSRIRFKRDPTEVTPSEAANDEEFVEESVQYSVAQIKLSLSLESKIRKVNLYRFVLLGFTLIWAGTMILDVAFGLFAGWFGSFCTNFYELFFLFMLGAIFWSRAERVKSEVLSAVSVDVGDRTDEDVLELEDWIEEMQANAPTVREGENATEMSNVGANSSSAQLENPFEENEDEVDGEAF